MYQNAIEYDTLPDSLQWLKTAGSFDGVYFVRMNNQTADVYAHRSTVMGGSSIRQWNIAGAVSYNATRLYENDKGEQVYLDGAPLQQKSKCIIERHEGPLLLQGWFGTLGSPRIPAPLIGGVSARSRILSARIMLGLCHDIAGASAIKLINAKTGAYRTLSYAFAENRYWGTIDRAIGFHSVRLGVESSTYETERQMNLQNQMTLSGRFRFLHGQGAWRYFKNQWGMGVSIAARSGGGYCAGYDGSGIRFALADSIGARSISASADLSLPGKTGIQLSAERVDLGLPFGYMNGAPFSAWAMFDPVEYHLRKGSAQLQEIILTVNDTLKKGRWKIVPEASIFNDRIETYCITKELKTMLLIPYYTNIDTLKPIQFNGILLALGCSCSYRTGPWSFEGSILQNAIPLYFSYKQYIQPSSGTSGNPSGRDKQHQFNYGGLRVGIAITVAIPEK